MLEGFKSLNSDRKFNVVMGTFMFCLGWVVLSLVMDTMVFGKGNYVNPDINDVDTIDKVYIVDGKKYPLKQKVTLVDGKLVVETIEVAK